MRSLREATGQIVGRILMGAVLAGLLFIPIASAGTGQARAASGISLQTVTVVSAVDGGGQLVVWRIVVEPRVSLSRQSLPGPSTFVVMSGTLQTTLVVGGAATGRYGIDQNAEIGATMNLSAGQIISYSPGAVMTLANLRSEPLVLIVTMLADPDEPSDTLDHPFVLI